MSTQINVTVDSGGLLERSRQQQAANRQAFVQGEASLQAVQKGADQRAADRKAAGLDPTTGRPLASAVAFSRLSRIEQEPAASRRKLARNIFALFRVIGNETEPGVVAPDLPEDSKYTLKRLTSLSSINDRMAVIYIGTRVACFTYSRQDWFQDSLGQLADFARRGGIVVINSEWSFNSCAQNFQGLTSDVNAAFGTSIVQNPGIQDLDVSNLDVHLAQPYLRPFMPSVLKISASATYSGGTPLYVGLQGLVVSAYQRVGKGALVRWGDSNDTGGDPTIRTSFNSIGDSVSFAEGLVAWQNKRGAL